ncbi:tetratricopeptide repeat protein [Streptomyces sp. SID11385]|uniref:tetratricopeptide repeat protein n=1 Tax=Streptomyces sp. SID11385 TaxID=2706031 RepID=UPI0013CB4AED|nr:tetratricopeptide repeat protein [Streptomyces sp. SID11385]NEA43643.1 tetratricopeptide repeat protein [Streptomyces sp. SID11385]
MTSTPSPPPAARDRLRAAVALREAGNAEDARTALLALSAAYPRDPEIAYQTAWAHDVLGREAAAVPFYETALAGADALGAEDRHGVYLGLGSTYRILGRYEDAVATLEAGLTAHPGDGALTVFLAMARHNTGAHHEALSALLTLLADTSTDPGVRAFRKAIAYYAEDLDRVETGEPDEPGGTVG